MPVGNEEYVFKAAFRQGLSVVLKGPTGCGKTRFVEAMAYDLDRPLITVAVPRRLDHGRSRRPFLLHGGETEWVDGPTDARVREAQSCYRRRGGGGVARTTEPLV
ncbi:AAA family ATPase [Mycolicibacterium vaccae]|nr:AAA family ATPase [Mycolicibacterium vaccae]